jgi:chromosome segregation ATPase
MFLQVIRSLSIIDIFLLISSALEETILQDKKDYTDLNAKFELLEEEHVMFKAKLSIEKEQLQTEIQSLRYKIRDYELAEIKLKKENLDVKKKVDELERRQLDLSSKSAKASALEYEKKMLSNSLEQKQREYETLKEENDMNSNQVSVLKKEVSFSSGWW